MKTQTQTGRKNSVFATPRQHRKAKATTPKAGSNSVNGAPVAASQETPETQRAAGETFNPSNVADTADSACAVRDWTTMKLPAVDLPHCMTAGMEGFCESDAARLFALTFVRHRSAWLQLLGALAAVGIQPGSGRLAEALTLSETIVRRHMLRPERGEPLAPGFTLPLPGLAGQYVWDMANASVALAFVLWDQRAAIEHGAEFAGLSHADRAELAEAVMLAELTLTSEGISLDGSGKDLPNGKATTAQRIAWHRLTTVVGLGAAA